PPLAEPFRPARPVRDPPTDARQIAHLRPGDAGFLDEEHTVPRRGEPRHDLLVALPDEVPVDRRDADDVRCTVHGGGYGRGLASASAGSASAIARARISYPSAPRKCTSSVNIGAAMPS